MKVKNMNKTNRHKIGVGEMEKARYIGSGLSFMTIGKVYIVIEKHRTYAAVVADDGEPVYVIIEDLEFI